MLEWIVVIVTVFNVFFGAYRGPQTQVRNYQTQYPQAVGNPYWSQGSQVYHYGQSPQAYAYPQGY
jgi:hypothetical protein